MEDPENRQDSGPGQRPHSRRLEDYGLAGMESDRLTSMLVATNYMAVRALAILMTLLIIWSVFDVVWQIYQRLISPPDRHPEHQPGGAHRD